MSMSKKEFDTVFKESWLPLLKENYPNDKPAWRTAYNDQIDSAQKDGHITERQANTWTHPKFLK